ncbi:hypothetical protein [Derxia lacustris]|uniref:hypothetical protein n=1 Tax=Derxia lacustris TaxID=764842 RepID=UPI000A1763C5|nr:hypothetical protein [Derxia lacustris]
MNITSSALFAALATTTAGDPAAARTARHQREQQTLAQAMNQMRNLPDAKQIARQRAAGKIARLQARLMELRMLLQHASPQQARLLAREIGGLAGELAQAARAAGMAGSGSAGATPVSAEPIPSGGTDIAPTGSPSADAADESSASDQDADRDSDRDSSASAATDAAGRSRHARSPAQSGGDASPLQRQLEDARRLLREVIALARARLREGDEDARRELAQAERALSASGTASTASAAPAAPASGVTAALYTSLGTADGGAAASASGGLSLQA